MSESARHLLHVEHLVRGVLNAPCCDDEINGGDNNGALRNQKPPALHTVVNADVAASCAFRMPNVGNKVLSDVHGFQQFQFRHDCPPTAANHDHATLELAVSLIRRGVALVKSNSKAAEGRGIPSAALVHHGEGHRRNHINSNHAKTNASTIPAAIASIIAALSDTQRSPRKNHLNPKYVSAISIAAPIHHHMRTAFGFVLQSSHSDSQSRRSAAATACAISLSTRRWPASSRRGCVSSR